MTFSGVTTDNNSDVFKVSTLFVGAVSKVTAGCAGAEVSIFNSTIKKKTRKELKNLKQNKTKQGNKAKASLIFRVMFYFYT